MGCLLTIPTSSLAMMVMCLVSVRFQNKAPLPICEIRKLGGSHLHSDCMWLDADHSPPDGGHIPTAVQIHMQVSPASSQLYGPFPLLKIARHRPPAANPHFYQDFTNLTSDYSKDPAYYCEQECMIFHSGPHPELNFKKGAPHKHELFAGHPEGGSCCMDEGTTTMTETKKVEKEEKEKRQRVIKPRSRALANRLIASPRDQHLASKLCESKTSHGPDFVSLAERVFCDMGTKIHYPLCEEERLVDGIAVAVLVDGCYRWETHSLVTGGEHVARNYERIEEWE